MPDFTPAPGGNAAERANPHRCVDSAALPEPDKAAGKSGVPGVPCVPGNAACARERALALLRQCDPFVKAAGVIALRDAVLNGRAAWYPERQLTAAGAAGEASAPGTTGEARGTDEQGEHDEQDGQDEPGIPGRPADPRLVSPRELEHRAVTTTAGRAALLHALAHIEFNAINLALDALWRFDALPLAYYDDWLLVAAEEAYHFSLLAEHLTTLGDEYHYGCFPAHDGLWVMARKTSGDWLARLALVPRTLEARGLDASPPIRAKLASAGDKAGAAILDIILRDEIGHVAIGNRWYRWGCERAGCEPVETYARLAAQYGAPRLRGPFNIEARRAAGFDDDELAALQAGG